MEIAREIIGPLIRKDWETRSATGQRSQSTAGKGGKKKGMTQSEYLNFLINEAERKGLECPFKKGSTDTSVLSKIMSGDDTIPVKHYEAICKILGTDFAEDRLRVGFAQGFWGGALIRINSHDATPEFFQHVAMTGYSDKQKKPIFNPKGEPLKPFNAEEHDYFYSGEVGEMLREGKIDIGFMGSTVVDERSMVRVARVSDAKKVRHAMIVVFPKGKFANKESVINTLLEDRDESGIECYIYYQPRSTSDREFRLLFQPKGHLSNTIQVLDKDDFTTQFQEKIQKHVLEKGRTVAHIGLMLSVTHAKEAVEKLDTTGESLAFFQFRTSEFVEKAGFEEDDPRLAFHYEMVVQRDNAVIRQLAYENEGFRMLLPRLEKATNDLAAACLEAGTPLPFRQTYQFFDLERNQAIENLRKMGFELLFYPEWVNKILK